MKTALISMSGCKRKGDENAENKPPAKKKQQESLSVDGNF